MAGDKKKTRPSIAPPIAEEPVSMGHVKRVVRAKLRRKEEIESVGINIYPMMDMMTILLVYMMALFASSAAAVVTESEELQIPYSTSKIELGEVTSVQISRNEIVVKGTSVLELRNGVVDPSLKQGGSSGFLITALFKHMGKLRDAEKQVAAMDPTRPFTGELQIIADKRTPFRTLAEVIYTVGQTEFKNLRFVVTKQATD